MSINGVNANTQTMMMQAKQTKSPSAEEAAESPAQEAAEHKGSVDIKA
jgi:hypothetical protein